MTPLAIEILGDLGEEFPDGANVTELQRWLGDPREAIAEALNELITLRLIHRDESRYFHGLRPGATVIREDYSRADILRLLKANGGSAAIVADLLGLSRGTVAGVKRRHAA